MEWISAKMLMFIGRYSLFSLTAAGIAFGIANYVSDKYVRGFDASIATLNESVTRTATTLDSSMSRLSNSVNSATSNLNSSVNQLKASVDAISSELNSQVADMRREREQFNAAFAKSIEQLRGENLLRRRDIDDIRQDLKDIKISLKAIHEASAGSPAFLANWTSSGGMLDNALYKELLKDAGFDEKTIEMGGAPIFVGPVFRPDQ